MAGAVSDRRHCVYVPPRWLPYQEEVRLSKRQSKASPGEAYVEALSEARTKTNQHIGQRKLLISEVQLLTTWYASSAAKSAPHPVLVYVGAAPGSHDLFLHRLFPHVNFILYDGAPFDERLKAQRTAFEVRNEYFTDAHCAELIRRTAKGAPGPLAGRPMLFVCDMRSDAPDDDAFESQVMRDMLSQRRWVETLRPELSLLKFRLPYTLADVPGATVSYLKGRLLWGVWATRDSGETRLLVKKADVRKSVDYDYEAYERARTFHNHYTRRVCFADAVPAELSHLVFGAENAYCSCFDCLTELVTYKKYLEAPESGGPFRTVEEIARAYNTDLNIRGLRFPMAKTASRGSRGSRQPPPPPPLERFPLAARPKRRGPGESPTAPSDALSTPLTTGRSSRPADRTLRVATASGAKNSTKRSTG